MLIPPRESDVGRMAAGGKVVFDADLCGIGDTILHCWHAEGYKAIGIDCSFYSTRPDHQDILAMLGQTLASGRKNSIVTGANATHYQYELRVDHGQTERALCWARCLPLQPKPIRPMYTENAQGFSVPYSEVLLFPMSAFSGRTWPLAYWVDLAWLLRGQGLATCICVPPSVESKLPDVPHKWVPQNWREIAYAMKRASLVIGNDSGPAHLSGTLNVPTLAIMGPTSNIFGHCGSVVEWTGSEPGCAGCHFDYSKRYRAACDIQCRVLMHLTPEIIGDQAMRMLNGNI